MTNSYMEIHILCVFIVAACAFNNAEMAVNFLLLPIERLFLIRRLF